MDKPDFESARDAGGTLDAFKRYMRDVDRIALLTAEEERELGARVLAGDPDARRRLVEANLRFVVRLAWRYWRRGGGLPFLDLIQEGNLGLLRAVETYDPAHGVRLTTYSAWWIKQRIGRAIALRGSLVKVPAQFGRRDRNLALAANGDGDEVAAKLGVTRARVDDIQRACRRPVSIDAPINESEGSNLHLADFLADPRSLPGDGLDTLPVAPEDLRGALDGLHPREATVVALRFGLNGQAGGELTLQEVGARLRLTRERVRQIEQGALRKLRTRLRRREWALGRRAQHRPATNGTLVERNGDA